MISRRVADNPLVALKDDLQLALRRIQLDLDAYREHPAEIAPLETMVDAIDQIRVPLAVLDHQQAVALLDGMRETAIALTSGELQSLDITVLQQAADQLMDYLEACVSPGNRRPDAELSKTAETLRRARRQSGLADTGHADQSAVEQPTTGSHAVMEVLKRLQQAVARLEQASDQPQSWAVLRDDLRILYWMLAERDWSRSAYAIGRLDRIVDALAAGAAESYGSLVSGVCAEILAQLSYGLESCGDDGLSSSVVLRRAEDHLAQLDTLLNMPALAETAIAAALVKPPSTPPTPITPIAAMPDLELNLPEWPEPASLTPKPEPDRQEATSTAWDESSTFDWPELNIQWPELEIAPLSAPRVEPVVSIAETAPEPVREPVAPMDRDEAAITTRLIPLIGLVDADPEFVEVFIEEARGELATIREQLILWRENLTDREALTTIRRAFHTLKGSGRMVGATVIGDFAWEFETLLNQVLEAARRLPTWWRRRWRGWLRWSARRCYGAENWRRCPRWSLRRGRSCRLRLRLNQSQNWRQNRHRSSCYILPWRLRQTSIRNLSRFFSKKRSVSWRSSKRNRRCGGKTWPIARR